ncbi:hypothetical protein LLE49_26320 [Alicyclobacillus tolerans]|uniref:hypothetical protein n=1 Tax=Alicyclobacillus tolerans TaxID=90970 RepID=UPI001F47B4A4|nr:hypothetical protein [Alicyclobacillus tolerans]MCF8568242.1 hypothetical protein [Alicyclobacillus tolerans]
MNNSDDELRELFKNMTELFVSERLRNRILNTVIHKAKLERRRSRFLKELPLIFAPAVGLAVASMFLVLLFNGTLVNQRSRTTATVVKPHVKSSEPSAYKLTTLPISVSGIHVRGENVSASLTNNGSIPIRQQGAIGVLSFSSNKRQSLKSNPFKGGQSVVFVNLLNQSNGSILPHQTVTWNFKPIGSPVNAQGNLVGNPYLIFIKSQYNLHNSGNLTWNVPTIKELSLKSSARQLNSKTESIHVSVTLTNVTTQPISLSRLKGIVWFDKSHDWNWMKPAAVRFIEHVTPNQGVIKPNSSMKVRFDLIGSPSVNYAGLVPHVVLVQIPINE